MPAQLFDMMILSNEVLLLGLLWVVDPEYRVVAHGRDTHTQHAHTRHIPCGCMAALSYDDTLE